MSKAISITRARVGAKAGIKAGVWPYIKSDSVRLLTRPAPGVWQQTCEVSVISASAWLGLTWAELSKIRAVDNLWVS